MPPPENPESAHHRSGNPGLENDSAAHQQEQQQQQQVILIKPPFPSLSFTRPGENGFGIDVPHAVAGALVASFAATVADGLGNELLTYYYLEEQRVKVNLDRVLDGFFADFTGEIWDELWEFYYAANAQHAKQLKLLFQGPVRQMILSLNSPELAKCLLDRIAPGLSRRMITWTASATGVDLDLALKLVCRYWHHQHPEKSPGGDPDAIARTVSNHTKTGNAFRNLLHRIRRILYTPHYVQMNMMSSAIWDIVVRRPYPPPADGFHVLQFRFECDPRQRIMDQGHLDIASFPAIIGTPEKCLLTTISEYITRHFPRCAGPTIRCLTDAFSGAAQSLQQSQSFTGMSFWDDSNPEIASSPGLRLIHTEVEEGMIRMSVSAWISVLVEMLQQMAWMCAALSATPFPQAVAECALQITDWDHMRDSSFVNCSLAHRAVPAGGCAAWLQQRRGAVVVPGFPIEEHIPPDLT